MKAHPDLFVPLEKSDYFQTASENNKLALQGKGLYVSKEPITIDQANATYQNFTNGMVNTTGDAIKNGMDQTGSLVFTVNYNPTHGFIGDLLESGVDKMGGTTGIARQTGQFIYDVTTARGNKGSNFAAHSQGNLLTKSGIKYQNRNGGFQDQPYFIDKSKPTPDEQKAGIPTFSSYGSPVNTTDMETTIEGKNKDQFIYNGAYTKDGDAVGEVLGGNKGQNQQMKTEDRIESVENVGALFDDKKSPHSTYLCANHENAKQNCGYKP